MTGFYIRMKRDGQWLNIEVDELTDAELEEWRLKLEADGKGGQWAIALAKWIRDHVKIGPKPG